MTRKHFQALADALQSAYPLPFHSTAESRLAWSDAAVLVAGACATFNPNFDRAKFLAACTPPQFPTFVAAVGIVEG